MLAVKTSLDDYTFFIDVSVNGHSVFSEIVLGSVLAANQGVAKSTAEPPTALRYLVRPSMAGMAFDPDQLFARYGHSADSTPETVLQFDDGGAVPTAELDSAEANTVFNVTAMRHGTTLPALCLCHHHRG